MPLIPRAVSVTLWLALILVAAGCATTRQSAVELNAGLLLVVPSSTAQGWPRASDVAVRLERTPKVAVGWSRPVRSGDVEVRPTKAAREAWIAAVTRKLAESGRVAGAVAIAPDRFDEDLTLAAVQHVAAEQGADVVLLFSFEVTKRRYHAFGAMADHADVESQVEVVTLAHAAGFTPSGVPVVTETQKGFASGTPERRSFEELQATSQRVAVNALSDAIVARLRVIAPEAAR
ncbi:MAG TPA: hypothetical protein VFN94_04900 [Nitrospiria bacterium]|nr:hypothetical protein [Nitrospiria bacterium]